MDRFMFVDAEEFNFGFFTKEIAKDRPDLQDFNKGIAASLMTCHLTEPRIMRFLNDVNDVSPSMVLRNEIYLIFFSGQL
jgi:hypothetical protein